MSGNYWRGIPADRLPSRIFRAEYTRLNAAIDAEKARISTRQYENAENGALRARSTDASGEGIENNTGDTGADRGGEPRRCTRCGSPIGDFEAWGNAGWCDACAYGEPIETDGE